MIEGQLQEKNSKASEFVKMFQVEMMKKGEREKETSEKREMSC